MSECINNVIPSMYEWPRYKSGKPLKYDDLFIYEGNMYRLWHVDFDSFGLPSITARDRTVINLKKGELLECPWEELSDRSRQLVNEAIASIDTLLEDCPRRKLSWVKVSSMTLAYIKSKLKEAIGENED